MKCCDRTNLWPHSDQAPLRRCCWPQHRQMMIPNHQFCYTLRYYQWKFYNSTYLVFVLILLGLVLEQPTSWLGPGFSTWPKLMLFWNPVDGRDKLRLFLNKGRQIYTQSYLFHSTQWQVWARTINSLGKLFDVPRNVPDGRLLLLRVQIDAGVHRRLLPQSEPDHLRRQFSVSWSLSRGWRALSEVSDACQGRAQAGRGPQGAEALAPGNSRNV